MDALNNAQADVCATGVLHGVLRGVTHAREQGMRTG